MTKEQIDILVKDGDIIEKNNEPVYHIIADTVTVQYRETVCSLAINERNYELSEKLIHVLNKIFEYYLGIETERSRSSFICKTEHFLKETLIEQKIIYLKNRVQQELLNKESIRNQSSLYVLHQYKMRWVYYMFNYLPEIIEIVKFKVLAGGALTNFNLKEWYWIQSKELDSFNLLNNYFLFTKELKIIYDAVAVDENLKYLQARINRIEKESGSVTGVNNKGNLEQKQDKSGIKCFDELFIHPYNSSKIIDACIQVLRDVEPSLINENNAVERCYKTGFVIWVNKLKGWAIQSVSDKTYVQLLNSKFPGLNFKDDQMFRKVSRDSYKYKEYETSMDVLISKVKADL